MKLLLDENLSRRIVPLLKEQYPGTTQVTLVGLERTDDTTVWNYAKENDYVIVTKDDDFNALLFVRGYPPKVIRLLIGNCTNQDVVHALLSSAESITSSLKNKDIGLIELC